MKIRVEWLNKKTCRVTLIPGWLARLFGAETRVGIAVRGVYETTVYDDDDEPTDEVEERVGFFWKTTDRYVGWRVMQALDAAPVPSIDEMTVEQLLLEEPQRKKP